MKTQLGLLQRASLEELLEVRGIFIKKNSRDLLAISINPKMESKEAPSSPNFLNRPSSRRPQDQLKSIMPHLLREYPSLCKILSIILDNRLLWIMDLLQFQLEPPSPQPCHSSHRHWLKIDTFNLLPNNHPASHPPPHFLHLASTHLPQPTPRQPSSNQQSTPLHYPQFKSLLSTTRLLQEWTPTP